MDFLTLMFTIFGVFALIVGALFISIFVGWSWGVENAGEEVRANDGKFPLGRTWAFLIRWLVPIALAGVLINTVLQTF